MRIHTVLPRSAVSLCLAAMGLLCSTGSAGAAEVALTAPSGLTGAGVTLNGTVDPQGVATGECWFEYSRATRQEYAFAEPCSPNPGSGSAPVTVSAHVGELAVDTAYHYRIAVTNEEGSFFSSDQLFVTSPQVEGTELASTVTSFAATLTGVIKAGEVGPLYHFAYGPTGAYGSSAPIPDLQAGAEGDQAVTQVLTGLQPATTYHFALVTTNFGGGVSTGPDETFTTRPLVPPVVSTGAAEAVGETAVTLTGAADPQGLPTTYQFEYGTSIAYGSHWPNIHAPAGSASGAQAIAVYVENLQPGTTYHYRLAAVNEDGTSYGPDHTLTTQGYPVSAIQATPVGGPLGVTLAGSKAQNTTHHAKKAKKRKKKKRRTKKKRR
jgi:hypothetical protein